MHEEFHCEIMCVVVHSSVQVTMLQGITAKNLGSLIKACGLVALSGQYKISVLQVINNDSFRRSQTVPPCMWVGRNIKQCPTPGS